MAAFSPMMRQYFEIKEKHKEHILFFRLGDFYEMFFDDALKASKELELTLTGRECGQEERAPMCGVPHHSCEGYIARLIKKGYKVAICEQVEDPKDTKGIVKREVVRIITPGTLIEANMLDENVNNFIGSIYFSKGRYGLAVSDISTGEVKLTEFSDKDDQKIKNELSRFAPSEIIFNDEFLTRKEVGAFIKDKIICSAEVLEEKEYLQGDILSLAGEHFGLDSVAQLSVEGEYELAQKALLGLFLYIEKTQKNAPIRLNALNIYSENQYMHLDANTRRNLELTETMISKEKKGSLLWVIDKTKTPMGKRFLRANLEKPLINPTVINKRLNAVSELFEQPILADDLSEQLSGIYDLERLMTRIIYGTSGPRELKALEYSARKLPFIRESISNCTTSYLKEIHDLIDPLEDIANLIESAIKENPPLSTKDGYVINDGYSRELDEMRSLLADVHGILAGIEQTERENTGIKTLKIGYNKVFGYYIEITKSYISQAPDSYIRKQTLANCERYITPELKELEERILDAQNNMLATEQNLFEEVKTAIALNLNRVSKTANAISQLDFYLSLAKVASEMDYTKPIVNMSDNIIIKEGRHPVVEAISSLPFVANETYLNNKKNQIAVITGPNMSGKSTYMRQTALIVLLAQIGSFVPAKSAEIGIVDGIFTRVGASDDLTSGQSTFMVEMNEVASILKNATAKSLLILDEIGRGTSTYDGMSIARSVIEYLATTKKIAAKTLFATHYHELVEMEEQFDVIKNYHIAAKKRKDDIVFLRKIVPGGTDDSYGIEVSKLAGIPEKIINRAYEILETLENSESNKNVSKQSESPKELLNDSQISFANTQMDTLTKMIKNMDVNTLTPIEALNKLYEIKKIVD